MNIRKARLCVQCDEVHELMCCPVCGGHEFLSLHNYLPPMWPDPAHAGVTGVMRDEKLDPVPLTLNPGQRGEYV